jgi:CheY-like chemotaxis protein
MPYAAVSFVEVDSISFQSKIGFEVESLSRNDWFDAYTILPESSEVYVIGDCSVDARFKEKPFVKNGPRIKFYAGAAIMIDDVKIGVLSIMDTEAHNYFGLEDKENLLDLGAAVAQLAKEKLQKTLNLSAERANIVVSMMHHLRTPMTSLNFATSLLCNDIQQIKVDASIDATPMAVAANSNDPSLRPAHGTTSINSTASNNQATTAPPQPEMQQIPALFQSFESSFNEINMALNQLNILVDSSLSLGQAIIKCSNQDAISQLSATSPNPLSGMNSIPASVGGGMMGQGNNNDPRKNKFSECNLIEYLRDMFHHHLPIHNNNLDVEWIIETTDLCRGSHVTFPDAIMLIVISTVSHMSTESNSLGFYFNFQPADEEDFEYPELVNKMIEGKLSVKILAKDEKLPVNNNSNATDANNISSNNNTNAKHFNNFQAGNLLSTLSHDMDGAELLTKQNFLSIDKILRAINGSSKEYIEDISKFGLVEGNVKDLRTIHEFFIPCKILLNPNQVAQGNPHKLGTPKSSSLHHTQQQLLQQQQQERQRVRLYRPPASNTYGLNDCGIKVTYENPLDEHLSEKDLVLTSLAMNEMKPTAAGGGGGNENNLSINTQTPTAVNNQVAPPKQKVLRVLVVEDTIPVQKLLTRWLQNHGCEVTCANNGKIGLDYLTTQSFDIAFVDFLMVKTNSFPLIYLFFDFAFL